MEQEQIPVKPWASVSIGNSANSQKAKIWYVMHLKGVTISGIHKLLGDKAPSQEFISMVISGYKKSRKLEERIAVILGVTWDDLFGVGAGKVRAA